MQLKIPEPDSVVIWVVIGIFATWGGVVRLLLQDTKSKTSERRYQQYRHKLLSRVLPACLGD